jgi:hypothetical protein
VEAVGDGEPEAGRAVARRRVAVRPPQLPARARAARRRDADAAAVGPAQGPPAARQARPARPTRRRRGAAGPGGRRVQHWSKRVKLVKKRSNTRVGVEGQPGEEVQGEAVRGAREQADGGGGAVEHVEERGEPARPALARHGARLADGVGDSRPRRCAPARWRRLGARARARSSGMGERR